MTQVRRAINSRCCSCASASPAISAVKVATAPGISIDKASPFSNCHRPGLDGSPAWLCTRTQRITWDFGDNNRNRSRADAGDGIDQRRGDDQGLGRSSVVLPVSRYAIRPSHSWKAVSVRCRPSESKPKRPAEIDLVRACANRLDKPRLESRPTGKPPLRAACGKPRSRVATARRVSGRRRGANTERFRWYCATGPRWRYARGQRQAPPALFLQTAPRRLRPSKMSAAAAAADLTIRAFG